MADIDTSSYLKPAALPAQKSLLDQVGQYQQLESNKNTIDKQKLDLVNQRFGELAKGFTGLIADKDLTTDKIKSYVDNQVRLGYIPQEMANNTLAQLPANADANTLRAHLKLNLQHAQTTVEAINNYFGSPSEKSDSATTYQGVTAPAMEGGGFKPSTRMAVQPPPTTETVDDKPLLPDNKTPNPNYGSRGIIGPSGAPGVQSAAPSMPVEAPINRMAPAGNVPGVQGQSSNFGGRVLSANAEPPTAVTSPSFDARFKGAAGPSRLTTSLPPGTAEAIGTVAASSGKDFATDLSRARNFKQDLYPAEAALAGIKELGTQNVGPGTPALNDLKSAIITWLPNPDKTAIDKVGTFQETRKYLTQIARASGNTGTNDQLAAAFEGNPSITMSKAATENVLKSVIALRKMQHAQVLLAEKENVQPAEYSKWIAKNQNVLDARAFGFDMMSDEAKKKLVITLKKDPKSYKRFEESLQFAHDANLIEPPARK